MSTFPHMSSGACWPSAGTSVEAVLPVCSPQSTWPGLPHSMEASSYMAVEFLQGE